MWDVPFAFSEGPLTYNGSHDDARTYSVDELKQHSWRFWFNAAGNSAAESASGFYNCYNPKDDPLHKMRLNDWEGRLGGHYTRTLTPGSYRTPSSLAAIPALMEKDERFLVFPYTKISYFDGQLRLPAGTRSLTGIIAANSNINGYANGWRETEHSDFNWRALPYVYPWYTELENAYPKNKE